MKISTVFDSSKPATKPDRDVDSLHQTDVLAQTIANLRLMLIVENLMIQLTAVLQDFEALVPPCSEMLGIPHPFSVARFAIGVLERLDGMLQLSRTKA